MFLLYNLFLTLCAPIWVPWMLWRSMRRSEKPNWQERFGNYSMPPHGDRPRIWFHCVSVGEIIAAKPILSELRAALPGHEIVLSVTTSSGHQTARELSPQPYDRLVYFPIDVARFQLAAMQRVQPQLVLIMETELWMNFLWAAKVFGATTILVNGRISDRSFPRSMKVRFFYQALLKQLDLALMQTQTDADRIEALGAHHAAVLGSSKFDQATEPAQNPASLQRPALGIPENAFCVVVGSTRGEEEEAIVMDALQMVWDLGIWVIHAPRHIETCAALLSAAKNRFQDAALFSEGSPSRYLIVDSYGLLAGLYTVADVALIGGGFLNLGGQNLIQPLAAGVPVLHGPHMQNFRDPTNLADKAGAAICCTGAKELGEQLRRLFADPSLRSQMSKAARELVQENLGASRRIALAVRQALPARK